MKTPSTTVLVRHEGPGASLLLFLVFLVLKLCGVIEWSWWWVTAPIWIPLAFLVSILVVLILINPKRLQ